SPSGLQLTLDGQPVATPLTTPSVVGVVRTIGAPSPQGPNTFTRWSDNGVQLHPISPPSSDTTYTAFFNGPATATTTTVAAPTTTSSSSTTTLPTGRGTTTTTVPAGGGRVAYVMAPGGGGSKDINVIRDGVKPPVGSDDSLAQYDTYNGDSTRTSDWIGATWATTQLFGRVVFQ